MSWQREFMCTSPKNQRVEYETNALAHHSRAERPDRVKVSGKVIHTGYVCDHKGFALFQKVAREGWAADVNAT